MLLAIALWLAATPPPEPPPALLVDGVMTTVWVDGEVTRAPTDASAAPTAPLIGETLGRDTRIEARAGGRLLILAAGDRLVALIGPGTWTVGAGQLDVAGPDARLPTVEPLVGYRDGPLPTLEAATAGPLEDTSLPPTLLILHPLSPVTRQDDPEIRWHWPYPGGRFDLTIEEIEDLAAESQPLRVRRLVERWQNLAGRAHTLWSPLERGGTYRVRLAHRAEGGASPIADERIFHVLDQSEIAVVTGALEALDALQATARHYRPEIDVLRARLLESHGLWDEAESLWTGLSILYPGHAELLHQALRLRAKSLARG